MRPTGDSELVQPYLKRPDLSHGLLSRTRDDQSAVRVRLERMGDNFFFFVQIIVLFVYSHFTMHTTTLKKYFTAPTILPHILHTCTFFPRDTIA